MIIASNLITMTVLGFKAARIAYDDRKQSDLKHILVTCPKTWIGFGNKCFYFSEDTRNWTFSEVYCAGINDTLAQFTTMEELNFLKRYKGPSEHWVGLRRQSSNHTWKWIDETEHNNTFPIRGVGEYAYLNDNGVGSASVYTDRKWICSRMFNTTVACHTSQDSSVR
ncbi:protein S28 [Saimiriine betaherpesvirus 4]|uniref:Protein S28 n=1 Tax=Saimiriine betaherpesvirus 4 TaxID=1535247 RepID=G8XT54_9BETA|nr:protein S28 [Saimiriine betaherpesvirus 4]AEV81003.1 protein S28 [Saimiriine betaherpesvirus 4]